MLMVPYTLVHTYMGVAVMQRVDDLCSTPLTDLRMLRGVYPISLKSIDNVFNVLSVCSRRKVRLCYPQ